MKMSQRWTVFLFFPVVLLVYIARESASQIPPQKSTPEGLQLLRKMQTALGGADRIAAIRDYEESIHGDTWLPDGSPLGKVEKRTRWIKRANVVRLDQVGPRDTYVLYYDRKAGNGWEILPDLTNQDPMRTTGTVVDLVGGELKFAKNYMSGFQINMWLADRMPGYAVTSPRSNVLRIIHDGTLTI